MAPAPTFRYAAPPSLDEAVALAAEGEGAAILAGGQTLVPLLVRREVRPRLVIDVNRIAGLDAVRLDGGTLAIGALVRQEAARTDPLVRAHAPLLAAALDWVANPGVRRRGTLVGNLVTALPGGEAVAAATLAGATLVAVSAAGETELPLGSTLPAGAIVRAVRIPVSPPCTRAGFYEVQRRFGHLGLVGAGVSVSPDGSVAAVFSGLLDRPLVAPSAAAALATGATRAGLAAAIAADLAGWPARTDLHADAAYRRAVAPVVLERALARTVAMAAAA